jgi:hypothetical protein
MSGTRFLFDSGVAFSALLHHSSEPPCWAQMAGDVVACARQLNGNFSSSISISNFRLRFPDMVLDFLCGFKPNMKGNWRRRLYTPAAAEFSIVVPIRFFDQGWPKSSPATNSTMAAAVRALLVKECASAASGAADRLGAAVKMLIAKYIDFFFRHHEITGSQTWCHTPPCN